MVQTLKLAGKKYALLPYSEYEKLKRQRSTTVAKIKGGTVKKTSVEDAGDLAEAQRVTANPTRSFVPWEEARKRLA